MKHFITGLFAGGVAAVAATKLRRYFNWPPDREPMQIDLTIFADEDVIRVKPGVVEDAIPGDELVWQLDEGLDEEIVFFQFPFKETFGELFEQGLHTKELKKGDQLVLTVIENPTGERRALRNVYAVFSPQASVYVEGGSPPEIILTRG